MTSFFVLSSHSRPATSGAINHQIYCSKHGYPYLFDATPYPLTTPYDQKLAAIIANMRRMNEDWLFWVDDDAFFMQMDRPLETILGDASGAEIIICRSPINKTGAWSAINAGLFFVRNNESTIALLEQALATPMSVVEAWWDTTKHGHFVPGGDQERMLYVFENNSLIGNRVMIRDHTAFNSRNYHFINSASDQFVCHLASNRYKAIPFQDMRKRFGLSRYLTPNIESDLAFSHSMFDVDPKPPIVRPTPWHRKVLKKINRAITRVASK